MDLPQLTYWQERLQNSPAMLTLATDKQRRAVTEAQVEVVMTHLSAAAQAALPENDTAVHLLAAYALLLMRHSQQNELVVGVPVAEQLLPLRLSLASGTRFDELVAQTAETAVQAQANAVPLPVLVTALQPAYDDSYAPFFQVVFATSPVPATEFNQLHDLTLVAQKEETGWQCCWYYRTDLFTESRIQQLATHYETLLENIVQNPETPAAELSFIPAAERELLLHTWNQTALDFPQDLCLHEWIGQQVKRAPERTAVSDQNTSLTYAQLDEQSGQLAAFLQQQGVQPGTVVAFLLPRTANVLVTLLGILKAGGVYLPLTTELPPERIQFILDDARVKLVITESGLTNHLPPQISSVPLDTQWDNIRALEPHPGLHQPTESLAYILYTSGSTGVPKGVPISHRNIVHLLAAMLQEPGMTADDKYLAITPFSFDILGYELYAPLLVGGEVVIASAAMLRDGHLLSERLAEGDITFMQSTPVTWQMLLAAGWEGVSHLKTISCGEALTRHLAAQIMARSGALWNLYGPTEATIFATGHRVTEADIAHPTRDDVPIGRPIANMQTYILDEAQRLLPVGAVGELYLGGEGLSQGYLNRPELTAEKFVPNPFRKAEGHFFPHPSSFLLYRTGDLARYRPDGVIEYLGRTDYQVKVHGLRIELGEIESRVQELAAVQTAVATTWINPANNDKQLVVYFVSASGEAVDTNQIRQALKKTLPSYMVPSILMQLPQLPATPNGKVDRKALPAPNLDALERTVPFAAPRSATETQLCTIWQSLLGISTIGIHDDFLDLGAHSLQATQLVTRVQEHFNVRLSLRDIFEQGTVARLAELITASQVQTEIPPITPAAPDQPLPVSFAQQRLLVIDQLTPNEATYNEHLALRLDGRLDEAALQTAVDALFARHDSLRTSFYYGEDGQSYQRIAAETHLPINHIDFSAQEEEALEWLQVEMTRPFSLTEDRLMRVSLLHLDDQQHILLIVIHHIITDGWSMEILQEELWQLYRAVRQNEAAALPPLNVQYADFALWQRQWLQDEKLNQQAAYWQSQLAEAPPLHNLPTDLPRRKLQSTRGTVHTAALSADLTQSLRQFSRQENATLFMTLFAAYNVLLSRHSQQDDIVVGTASANRHHPQIENLIGFFVNMLPLRTRIPKGTSFLALLEQVRQSTLDAQSYQDVPFEKVVDILQPTRDPSYSPIFQVAFTLENQLPVPQLEELSVTSLDVANQTAKYDLTLFVTETNDGLVCTWEYCTDLFFPETIARLHQHFETLLQGIVDSPETAVAHLPLLTEAEKQTILHEWQGKVDDTIPDSCLHQQFEWWVEKQPEVTAVSDENLTLTYQQLNSCANQLARLLIQQGVKPGQPVAIHMPGSVPAIIAILACHKARAAYVPFDPAYPTQRLQFMLDDTAAPVILTDAPLDHLETDRCTVLEWNAIQPQLAKLDDTNLDLAYTPSDPAYIIYTSGSTGQPKGVVCGHTGVFNLVRSADQWGALPPQTAASLWTTLNFDASVYEIFTALMSGGALHVVPPEIQADALGLFTWLKQRKIQSTYLPPFMVEPFAAWLRNGHDYPDLQRLLVGVEPLAEPTLVEIQQFIPGLTLINAYGPTEATVCATFYRVPPDSTRSGIAPIGRPLLNYQVYLLDAQMQPVPVGVAGELYIGGLGLAHGYLNRPELTNEKFVESPFDNETRRQGDKVSLQSVTLSPAFVERRHLVTSSRLYRTGDLARYLADGNILFIGRTDFQLKVRGFRVELGEIETHLLAQPGVASGVVLPYTAADGQTVLVAYFVPEAKNPADVQTLRDALNSLLPNYMVPSVWIRLEEMPRTPNDKIDRKALPIPNPDQLDRSLPFAAPRNTTEEQLLVIWQSLLSVSEISVHDNFFELGGHSLLATQLTSRIQKQLGIQLFLRDVLEHGSIARIAELIAESQAEAEIPPIVPLDRSQPLPVSFAQQRLLLLDQLAPNQATYNVPLAFKLDGRLDEAALQKTIDALYARHDSLRTTFFYGEDEQPYQHIAAATQLAINKVDFSHLPQEEREEEAQAWIYAEVQRPFALGTGPLIRVSQLRLAEAQHILVIVKHHIISDGWSVGILLREMSALYTAFVAGRPSPLPELPVQYADFAAWQRDWLQGAVLQQQLDYWLDNLQGATAVLTLPTDRPRPPVQSYRGTILNTRLPAELISALKQLTQEENATLFMALLAAFQTLLARYTQQEDIVVGSPIANRNREEIEGLIGFFVNMLVLRTDTSGNPSFRTLLNRVRQTTLGAYAHQDVPFEKLVETKQLARDMSYSPLFQVAFTLQNTPNQRISLPGLTLSALEAPVTTAKYDLNLDLLETPNGAFVASWEYSTALFDESTIARLAAHFNHLLEQIVANPDLPIDQLEILTPADTALMQQWNETQRPFPTHLCLHQLISQHAAQTPDRIAISDGTTPLTYRELETQSNQLAHHLLSLGVQPDTFVAVALERSAHLLVGLLGILKAGGAYLPIDPAFPAKRLQFMLADAQAPLLLTQSSLVAVLPEHQAQVICLDELLPKIGNLPTDLPETAVAPHNLAYIIYTSGSTGRPKGVQITHNSLVNLLTSMAEQPGIDPDDRLLAITTLSFDIATVELYLPLLAGAQIFIAPQAAVTDPQQLIDLLQQEAITYLQATPATWQMLLNGGWQGQPGLKMITGGEALSVSLAQQLLARGEKLWNMYAPSETTTYSTIQPVLAEELDPQQSIPIGRPLANTQLYILDDNLQPVPIGVSGELYIGGEGVARGYLNQPELTNERFIENPFDKVTRRQGDKVTGPSVTLSPRHLVTPSRLYKTGDLASFRPDGAVNFLGRSDHQVKIRGFRVELGEIESRLRQHPDVAQAVVHPFEQQLVAYLIFAEEKVDEDEVSTAELRTFLQETLPAYMIPHIFIPLGAFPLTPNGKVDRKSLPAPTGERDASEAYVAPRSQTEALLAEIWQTLLKKNQVGIHDNFFELGGHSLSATQLVSRIQKQFNLKLPLREIFEQSTVAQIAGLIEKSLGWKPDKTISKQFIPRLPDDQPLPLSFAQQRLLVMDELALNKATFNIPLAFKINGRLDEAALQTAVDTLYQRHSSLRTSFYYSEDGQPYQHIADEKHLPIVEVDFASSPAETREKEALDWLQMEAERPFSLTKDQLIRVALLCLGDQHHILVIVMHHIISDGWSADILFREMSALYTAFVAGRPSPLPELPIQYADFAAWQRDWLQGDVLQQQMDYWLDNLQGATAVLTLPTDRPRPPVQSYSGATLTSHIPASLVPALKQLTQQENATLFMALLAAFQTLLARYTQQEDVVVGSPIANRNRAEIEGLIGFFVNMLVLRTDTSGNPSFRTLLNRVRQTTLGAYAHQDIPFEKLVEAKQLARDMSYTPLFQVAFTLQNMPAGPVTLPGLKLSTLPLPNSTAKYDLTVDLTETAEGGLTANWEYSTALFDDSTIARLAAHFNHLLAQVAANPDKPIHQLEILTPADKTLMQQWNETERPFPTHLCLHQLISQHATQTLDHIAIADGNTALTYRELETQSNQLAHHLLSLGVQPDTFVAVALERSAHLLVGLLGILKAGGAYLPVDPAFPAQRIQFMLADAQAPLLLTQSSLVAVLPEHQAQVICLDDLLPKIADLPVDLPETAVAPHNLAYIIYTSGSTGRPKGVQITHNSLVNLLTSMAEAPGMDPDDKLLAITTLSFDIATVELYLPLLAGAQIFIAPQAAMTDPQQLIDLLQKEAITYLQATPATWQMLLNGGWQGQPGLKIITGGEALSVTLAQQLLARGEKLWNMYAPSETTTYSTIHRVLAKELDPQHSIPIGRPLANTQLYILDANRQPVPVGVTGELYIGGEGVARGYLNQPELTEERFIPNPFDKATPSDKVTRRQGDKVTYHPVTLSPAFAERRHLVTPSRLYKTGDLASFRPDGAVNFLGRSDHQVKIRGFRVELGEIESRLRQHPDVAQAVVHPFEQQLVAYLIFAEEKVDEVATTAELRTFLQETLPAYMIPHIFMPLETFPLTPNGKVDRKALPTPTGERDTTAVYAPPRNQIENQLAEIWQMLLQVDRVGIHDNFFELGGHSLLAIQLISAASQQLNRNVPLRILFDAPTVAGLAHHLETQAEAESETPVAERPFVPKSSTPTTSVSRAFPDDKLPLSLAQKRLWFFYKLNPQSAAYNVPIALRLRGAVNRQWLQQSLLDVIIRHEVLRTVFYEEDDVYGRALPVEQLPLRHTDLRDVPAEQHEQEVMKRVEDEVQRPFTLTDDIPIRIQLLELADDHCVLLLTLHHIAIDLWSIDLLVHEVVTIYRGYQENQTPDLPELSTQYGDYAAWQQSWLAEHQDEQLAYWQQTLAADPVPLALPTDKPRPAEQTDAGAGFTFQLPDSLSRQTHQFSHQEKATLFMVLLAAYHALLYRYTHQPEINVGSPIANRHHTHTENLLGFFVNTVVINASLTPQMSFRQLLHQVRQRALGAQENQDIPFNKVVEAIQNRRDPAYSPLFQTLFTAQTANTTPTIPGVKLEPIPFDAQTAKFDLTLSLTAQNEGLFGQVEYNTDLFSAVRIEQFSQHYVTLLAELLQHPDVPLAQIDMRTEAERLQQAQAAEAASSDTTLIERFAEIAAQFGNKTAVSTPNTTLTYRQLHQQSNQVAHLLHQQGIQPGDVVAIQATATPHMLTALLGVLKAGGVYLPLNQDDPQRWQQNARQLGQAKLLLYSQTSPPADGIDCSSLAIETAAQHPETDLPAHHPGGGIQLPYLSAYPAAELWHLADIYPIQAANRVLQFASFASHQAAHEIFGALLNGATLVLAPQSQLTKLSTLYELLAQTQIDVAILPAVLLGALDPKRVPHLQTAVSLEADMSPALWQKWEGWHRLHGYISATTILPAVLSPVEEPNEWLTGTPTAAAAIQDQLGQPVPTGVIGELHAGANLVPAGDQWRWLENGRLQFRQYHPTHTTTRGRYVHTTWIAEAISQHPIIQECVVLPDDGPCQKRQLHAYVVTRQPLDTEQLTQIARQHVPQQFVPAQFYTLDKIPVTAAGNIDYPALQDMQQKEAQSDQETDTRSARQAQLTARRENLSAQKQALLAKWKGKTVSDEENNAPLIPPRPAERPLPLSFAQQRLWFIEQINPEARATYNIPVHLEIRGALDVDALEHSFNQLLQRHESLRTRFVPGEDETPHQEIVPFTAVSLRFTDLSSLPAAVREAKAQELRQQNALTPLDLQNGPVYRIHLLRLDAVTHQLLFTVHHIAFDAWSTGLFLREIVVHYLQKTTGQALPLPPINVQYGDFTVWQQDRLTEDVMADHLAFWREHLAHAPTILELPSDKPRPQWQTSHGDMHDFTIPAALAEKVKQWTQAEQATLFVTLLTAFNGLLYRYTNQEDIVVGTPIANRNHPDLKNMIGFFLNTLALRTHMEETTTWQALLQQTRQTMLAAHAHQEYPFENLVQALLPDRDPSRHPLFQVMFVLQNQGEDTSLPAELPLKMRPIETATKTAKFDLMLHVQETAADFTAAFEYNTDLFHPETIARMAEHFQQMVVAMVSEPDQPIAQAHLLTPEEQKQIEAWNDTAVPIDPHQLIHHRFEAQVEKSPTAIAAEFGNDQLTYAELEAQANQLAHFLQTQGVQPGDRVGILLPRSLAMVTAVLGILKTGAGYVPLDPDYPADRLQLMLEHADAKLLLTHSSLSQTGVGHIRHNVDELDLSAFAVDRVTAVINPEHPVYIIFTSGSTGQPKGVTLPHRALNNMLAWQQRAMHRQGPARTLQFTSLSFDVHFQEMFTTWQDGGTLVLIADDVRRDGEQLLAYIQEYKIERLFLPFVALQNLAEAAQWQQSYPHALQEVITAGEALLSTPDIREFFTRLPHCAFHNHYGPSESHVVTQYTLGPDPQQWPDLPPIGTPIDNTQIHLLDSNMRPVPIGVPGELYIGGHNLALGYFNQPELTAERFIRREKGRRKKEEFFPHPSPFFLYKTGDLARYLPDGNIQYLGRNDFQVKIRGHRVELGEIEAVLNEQPAVQQAVVQAYKPDEGAHQLIAYIKTSESDVISDLQAALRERLPAYMVPAHFVRLEQFPLTPSGKINRRALPIPDKMEVARSTPFVAAETALQKQLVEVWERVLGVSPIGIHDNFFELGGHSLLALRLVAAMHKATAVKIPLPRLFQEGTIAALAEYISDPTAESKLSPVVQLRAGDPEQEPLIVVHPGSGQVLPYLKLVNALPQEQPVYGLQSVGLLPDTPAQTDVASMATTYLEALAKAEITQPYHLLGWSMGGVVAMEMAQQLNEADSPVGSLTLIDTFAPSSSAAETNETTLLQWFAQDTGYLTPAVQPTLLPDEASLDAQLRHLWPQLQATGNLPAGLTFQDLLHQFAVFRANYAAMQAYRPQKYRLPVSLIVAKASAKSGRNKWLGWKKYLSRRSVQVLPGTHFSLLQEPKTIKHIAEELSQLLPAKKQVISSA